jgi:hypothetical protein
MVIGSELDDHPKIAVMFWMMAVNNMMIINKY